MTRLGPFLMGIRSGNTGQCFIRIEAEWAFLRPIAATASSMSLEKARGMGKNR